MTEHILDKLAVHTGCTRKIYPNKHPDAYWCSWEELWLEKDSVLRERILAAGK